MQPAALALSFILLAGQVHALASTNGCSNFSTPLVNMPQIKPISEVAEVQVVLASFPFLAIGFVGAAFAGYELYLGRLNRSFLNLWIAIGAAFVAGIFQLFNVLRCELDGMAHMSTSLLIAQGVAIATSETFLLLFLFRKTQQRLHCEKLSLLRLPDFRDPALEPEKDGSGGGAFATPFTKRGGAHSGSYQRWGVFGSFAKVAIFLLALTFGLLDGVWRIGFLRQGGPTTFYGVYEATNAVQIVLAAFFFFKLVVSAQTSGVARSQAYLEILSTLAGITVLLVIASLNLVSGLVAFSDTPLGRFFSLMVMYDFLITEVVQDHSSPIRDSLSFDTSSRLSLASPPKETVAVPSFFAQVRSEENERRDQRSSRAAGRLSPRAPAFPGGIVVRRSSRLPSWLGRRQADGGEDMRSLAGAATPMGRSDAGDGNPLPMPPLPSSYEKSFLATRTTAPPSEAAIRISRHSEDFSSKAESSQPGTLGSEEARIAFVGDPSLPRVPASPAESENEDGPSISTARQNSRRGTTHARNHSNTPSTLSYDSRGVRLSSPQLDLTFSVFNGVFQRNAELAAIEEAAKFSSPRPAPAPPMPPVPAKDLGKRPALTRETSNASSRGRHLSVTPHSSSGGDKSSSDPGKSSDTSLTRQSEVSVNTMTSDFSLSNFPVPPPATANAEAAIPLATESEETRPSIASSQYHSNKSILTTTDGLEFELLPPQAPFAQGHARENSDASNSSEVAYDITSLIVGKSSNLARPFLDITASPSVSSGSYSPGMPVSPGASEVGEIRQVQRVARITSGGREDGDTGGTDWLVQPASSRGMAVAVAERGRSIPPLQKPDLSPSAFITPVGVRGLPSNPRRQQTYPPTAQGRLSPSEAVDTPSTFALSRIPSLTSSETDTSATSVSTTYDPKRPFERPRPAPLVFVKEDKGEVVRGEEQKPRGRTRLRGGRKREIVVVAEEEEGL